MKCLTICQPYAALIMRGEKRVENRNWSTSYRGPLMIHAGKSREWLELDETEMFDESYNIPLSEMAFGAIVGIVDLVEVVRNVPLHGLPVFRFPSDILRRFPWIADHAHAEGPCCLILQNIAPFTRAIPYRGQQGLFDVPDEIVRESIA